MCSFTARLKPSCILTYRLVFSQLSKADTHHQDSTTHLHEPAAQLQTAWRTFSLALMSLLPAEKREGRGSGRAGADSTNNALEVIPQNLIYLHFCWARCQRTSQSWWSARAAQAPGGASLPSSPLHQYWQHDSQWRMQNSRPGSGSPANSKAQSDTVQGDAAFPFIQHQQSGGFPLVLAPTAAAQRKHCEVTLLVTLQLKF